MYNKFLISLLFIFGYVTSEDQPNNGGRSISRDCSKAYSTTCLKLDMISLVERLSETEDYSLLPGVSVVREKNSLLDSKTADIVAELAKDYPKDAEARLNAFLIKKLEGYLKTHSIRLKLMDTKSIQTARALADVATGRGKDKKGGMGAIIAAAMMMKGTLGALGMGALAMMAGKALMTGLMALMLSAIIGLKALTSGGHKQTTYEIVTKPVYSHSNTHSSSHEDHGYAGHGYGRSMEINELPDGFPKSILSVS